VMNGNEAIGLGLIAAGVRFGAGYPITPWSDIMNCFAVNCRNTAARSSRPKTKSPRFQWQLRQLRRSRGGDRFQWSGNFAQTEALGWAVMAEMPLVIIDVQRGGPSTGCRRTSSNPT